MDTKDDHPATTPANLKAARESLWRRMRAGMDPVWASMQNAWRQLRVQLKK